MATGVHRGIATLYDYDYDPPYNRIFYFDNWYFTPFEAQNVYEPWQYFFTSPGYTYHTRRTERINLGSTYGSVTAQTYSFRGSIQVQGPDISYNVAKNLGDGVKASGNTISWSWAQNTALKASEGIAALNSIKSKLTSTQLNNRTSAFSCASRYITGCAVGHGCLPTVNSGGKICPGNNGTHVDVVIYKGLNFQE